MANTKISQLPEYTGNTSGSFLVMDSADLSGSYRVSKENLIRREGVHNKFAYYNSNGYLDDTPYFFGTPNGFTVAIGTDAYTLQDAERFMVDSYDHYNIATFQTSQQNNYAEVNIKNFGSGSSSSADLVLWNDVSTESSSYVDLGINSSNYSAGYVGFGGDGYLINAANDLYVGSISSGDHGHLHLFGGYKWTSSSISIYNDGTIGINTDQFDNTSNTIPTSGFAVEISGSVKMRNDLNISGSLTLGSLLQQPLQTKSPTDIGVTGQICYDTDYIYVCVGTNSWKKVALT